jgi:RNAse (barnase) inhibitor barstar
MHEASIFKYVPSWSPSGLVVTLPRGLHSKIELLHNLAHKLAFPDYFGENWDALVDCLSDLSWLDIPEVTLLHEELPGIPEPELTMYLQCLQDVLERKERGDRPVLNIAFAQGLAPSVTRLLRLPR